MQLSSPFLILFFSLTLYAQDQYAHQDSLYIRDALPGAVGYAVPLDATTASISAYGAELIAYPSTEPDTEDLTLRSNLEPRFVQDPCEIVNPNNSPTCRPVACGRNPLVMCTISSMSGKRCGKMGMDRPEVQNICGGCSCRRKRESTSGGVRKPQRPPRGGSGGGPRTKEEPGVKGEPGMKKEEPGLKEDPGMKEESRAKEEPR